MGNSPDTERTGKDICFYRPRLYPGRQPCGHHQHFQRKDYFNIPKASKYAYKLPINSQEAITTIYSAKEDFLNAAKEQIEAEYGSVQAYLKKGLGLSAEEIEQLRSILLMDNE